MKRNATHWSRGLAWMQHLFIAVFALSLSIPVRADSPDQQSGLIARWASSCTGIAFGLSGTMPMLSTLVPSVDSRQLSHKACACANDRLQADANILKLSKLPESAWKLPEQKKALAYLVLRLTTSIHHCLAAEVDSLLTNEGLQF